MQKLLLILLAVLAFIVFVLPRLEGFHNPSTKVNHPCPEGYKQCPSGDCVLAADVHGGCPA